MQHDETIYETHAAWLLSDAGRGYIAQVAADSSVSPGLGKRLRNDVGSERAQLIERQAALRRRAERKFPQAAEMFFTEQALEQATDWWTAQEKAHWIAPAGYPASAAGHTPPLVDLGCGIGGDLMALSQRAPVIAFEQSTVRAAFAAVNLAVCGGRGDVRAEAASPAAIVGQAVHVDPSRRSSGGRRTVQLDFQSPGRDFLEQLISRDTSLVLKLAPATDLKDPLLHSAHLQWIGHARDCRQLVAWYAWPGRPANERSVSILSPGLPTERWSTVCQWQRVGPEHPPASPIAPSIGSLLAEPHPTVLAAKLAHRLAREHDLAPLTPGGGYLTGERWPSDPAVASRLLRWYEVIEVLPWRQRKLKQIKTFLRLRGLGIDRVKKRGVEADPAEVLRHFRDLQGTPATLLLARLGKQEKAIIAKPL